MWDCRKQQFIAKLAVLAGEVEQAEQAAKRGDTDEAVVRLEQAEVRSRAIREWVEVASAEYRRDR